MVGKGRSSQAAPNSGNTAPGATKRILAASPLESVTKMSTSLRIDQSSDTLGQALDRITQSHALPDFVKAASFEAACGTDDVPSRLFALPESRQLPFHTKAATWTSLAYLADSGHLLEDALAETAAIKLADAARYWGLEHEAAKIASARLGQVKEASAPRPEPAPEDHAWTRTLPDGSTAHHCPIRDEVEAKVASEWFERYQDAFEPCDRRALAAGILTRSEAVGADLGDATERLEKAAGMGLCPPRVAAEFLHERADLVVERYPSLALELRKMASVVSSLPGIAPDQDILTLLDDQVRQIDRQAGLDLSYGRGVSRPHEALFAVTEKAARAFVAVHVELPHGDVYRLNDLGKVPADALEARMGSKVASEAVVAGLLVDPKRLAAALSEMGPVEAADFRKLAAEHGIEPIASGARPVTPTRQQLVDLVTA